MSNFQVAVVLILRASSDFLLIYFQMPGNNTAVVISQQAISAQCLGPGAGRRQLSCRQVWGDEAIFDRRKAFTMKGVSLHCKYMVNELTGKPDTDSSVRQAIISLARDTVPSSGRNLTKAGRKIRFVCQWLILSLAAATKAIWSSSGCVMKPDRYSYLIHPLTLE